MTRAAFLLLLAPLTLMLPGCITYHIRDDGTARARIGETVVAGGYRITPLAMSEDSRCPEDVQCVSAGRVRLVARIDRGSTSEQRDMVLGEAIMLADGSLKFSEVMPAKRSTITLYPEDYRFGFTFARNP